MLSIIAVIGKNRELGKDNHLLWHLPADLARFRSLTSGHPVIMGRKTFESIGRPLPNRTNIVITSHTTNVPNAPHTVVVVPSLDEAICKAKSAPGSEEIFVIGGGSVYAQAIDKADRLYLTVVDAEVPDADTFFPEYSQFTTVVAKEDGEDSGLRYSYLMLEKA